MAYESDESGAESGGALREKLEATIAANKAITVKLAEAAVKGFRYVKPEDLEGVSFDQFDAKATEIEAARAQERETLLRETLAEKGILAEDLDTALAKLAGDQGTAQAPQQQQSAPSRVASLGTLGGGPPSPLQDQTLFGASRIRAALGNGQ